MTSTPCFLGSEFEYSFTNYHLAKFAIRVYQARTFAMPNGNNHPRVCVPEVALSRPFAMPISNNRSDECAPERGYEPPAWGNALGNKGNITNSIHRQGQMPEASDKGSQPYRNAYGISSLAPQHINQTPTVFLPLQHITKSNA